MQSDLPNSAEAASTPVAQYNKSGIGVWLRENRTRLYKFASVGASGVIVNLLVFELCLFVLKYSTLSEDPRLAIANCAGIVVSILTNFILNDIWTWSDRDKGTIRDTFNRLAKYYVTASGVGLIQFAVFWLSLALLWSHLELHVFNVDLGPRLAVCTGIGIAMFFNFAASHLWTFRDTNRE